MERRTWGWLAAALLTTMVSWGPSSAADMRAMPALGTLPATDSLDEWERLTLQLTVAETLSAGILAGVMTGITVGMIAEGPPSDAGGWVAFPAMAGFGIGSVIVGTARGINLQRYRQARSSALAAGEPWTVTDRTLIRRWQARETRAVAVGMLIYAGVSAALLTVWNLSGARDRLPETFFRGVQTVFVVGLTVDLAAGTTNAALARRELYWLDGP